MLVMHITNTNAMVFNMCWYNVGQNKLFLVVYDIGKPISWAQALVPGARSAPEKYDFGVSGNTKKAEIHSIPYILWLHIFG